MSIFKAYDVRGIYPKEINTDIGYKIGRALVLFTKAKEVVVGHDMRMSSSIIHNALIEGIIDQGADVIDIGLCSTPMLYFAARKSPAAVMVTASHNPQEYNGFKICGKNAISISGESGLKKIEELVKKGKFGRAKKGRVCPKPIIKEYLEHSLKFAGNYSNTNNEFSIKNLKVVFDFGNGMSSMEIPKVMEHLASAGVESIYLFQDLDGRFPNHEANPIKPENLKHLASAVTKNDADMGVAFDGDGDRTGFVDEKGKMIHGDIILAMIAKEMLDEKNNAKSKKSKVGKRKEEVLYEIRSSWATREAIVEAGGKPVLYKAGHALIKEKMKKDDIFMGGEKAGHYFFRDNFYVESTIIAMLAIMKMLSREKAGGKTLSKIVSSIEKYYNSGEVNFKVTDADKTIKSVEVKYKKGAQKVFHVDGVTIEYRDWWFNLRKSNTEPLVRLNLEAKSSELMKKKLKEVSGMIKK